MPKIYSAEAQRAQHEVLDILEGPDSRVTLYLDAEGFPVFASVLDAVIITAAGEAIDD